MDVLKRLRRAALVAAYVCALAPCVATAQETLEPDVKATFLYNFTRFIEWPGPVGCLDRETPFRLCVVADAVIEQAIKRTVAGGICAGAVAGDDAAAHDRMKPRAARFCMSDEPSRSVPTALLAAVRDRPVLTVGDSPLFVESGGAIQFVLVENPDRFDVNLTSAQRANLKYQRQLAACCVESGAEEVNGWSAARRFVAS